jgi:kynurenine formamidase
MRRRRFSLRLRCGYRRERLARWRRVCCAACSLSVALLALPACGGSAVIDESKLVDLTYPLGEETIFWPTSPPFRFESKTAAPTPKGYWYAANVFTTAEHGGTHLDAPFHFAEHGWKADQIPVSRFIGPACVIDVTEKASADRDYRLTTDDILAWESEHGRLPEGAIVLVRTGWGKFWTDRLAYLGDDTPGDDTRLHFPGLSKEAARMLVRERQVDAVGIDTASIDHGPSADFIAHQILFEANVPAFENLANLERLPESGATLIALPSRIAEGSGGPLRAVALLP